LSDASSIGVAAGVATNLDRLADLRASIAASGSSSRAATAHDRNSEPRHALCRRSRSLWTSAVVPRAASDVRCGGGDAGMGDDRCTQDRGSKRVMND